MNESIAIKGNPKGTRIDTFDGIELFFSSLLILEKSHSFLEMENRCFDLSVNDCDCDVVFYCKLLCEPQESSYDSQTETCCCLSGK